MINEKLAEDFRLLSYFGLETLRLRQNKKQCDEAATEIPLRTKNVYV